MAMRFADSASSVATDPDMASSTTSDSTDSTGSTSSLYQVADWGLGPRVHDCATQHQAYPAENSSQKPEFYSYDANTLVHRMVAFKRQIHDINKPDPELANAYRNAAGTGNVDGLANITILEILKIFNKWAEIIDRRFFDGAFMLTPTQDGSDQSRLSINSCFFPLSNASGKEAFTTDIDTSHREIWITMRDSDNSNRRRSAASFFVLLVREMARAYAGLFYNYCRDPTHPSGEDPDREFIGNGCTGDLWFRVFYVLAGMIKTSIPELSSTFNAELDRPRKGIGLRAEMEWRLRHFKDLANVPSTAEIATVRMRAEKGLLYRIAHPRLLPAVKYAIVAIVVLVNVYIYCSLLLAQGIVSWEAIKGVLDVRWFI